MNFKKPIKILYNIFVIKNEFKWEFYSALLICL